MSEHASRTPTLTAWREGGRVLELRGHRIFVREAGSGPAMLLLHGFPTASYDFARIWPQLVAGHRLITLDFLGYGFSDKPRGHAYSLFEQADLVEAAAAHFGVRSAVLLAHDMGNSVCLELLRRRRLAVSRVVLLNGSVLLQHYRPLLVQRLLLHRVAGPLLVRLGLVQRALFARQFARLFAQPLPAGEIDLFWSLIAHGGGERNYHRLIGYLRERMVHEHTWLDVLVEHRAPLLLVWGQRDPVSVPAIAQAVLERRPDARYVPLADVGHYPQWEAPEAVVDAVRDFLAAPAERG